MGYALKIWALCFTLSVNENNLACNSATLPWTKKSAGKSDKGEGKKNMGASDCMIQMPRFQFKTGRTDCSATTYKASKSEVHPSAGANGPMTVDFFRDNFGMTGEVNESNNIVYFCLVSSLYPGKKPVFIKQNWKIFQYSGGCGSNGCPHCRSICPKLPDV